MREPSPPGPGPGWYPDPVDPGAGLRWWDGRIWTPQVQPRTGSSPEGRGSEFGGAGAPELGGAEVPAPPTPVLPIRALWWAVAGLVVGEVLGSGLAGVAEAVTGSSTSASVTLAGEIGLWAGMLGACLSASRRFGTGDLRRDLGLAIQARDIGTGVVVALVGTLLSGVVSAAFSGSRFAGTNTQILTGQRQNSGGFVVVTLVVALGAPFFEELFFRGLIRTALAAHFGAGRAVVAQAVLFGLAHYEPGNGWGNISVIVTIGLLGLVLGWVAKRTGRLGPGMVGHGCFNLVAAIIVVT